MKFEISDYLKRYKEEAEKLLDFKFPKDSDNNYTKTTFITWRITIDKIKDNTEYGQQAKEILDIIAYIASDNIPAKMFLGVERNEEKLGDAIQLLKQYSMISSGEEQSSVNIHRLVQQVTRIELEKQDKEKVVEKTFELLRESFPYGSDKLEDCAKKRQLLPHLEAFLSHIDNWLKENPLKKQTIEKDYLVDLLMWMDNGHSDLGNPRGQKELLERALPILKKHYGSDHFTVARALVSLGTAYRALGNPQKAKELLEQALPTFKEYYCSDHFKVARVLVSLGNAYKDLCNPHKAKELLERALAIQKKHYGPDHFEVAKTRANLGNVYRDLGNPQKAKELFERVSPVFEKHYGSGHIQVAKLLVSHGGTHGDLGDHKEKKELLEQAFPIFEEHYGLDHPEVAKLLADLCEVYGTLGDHKKQQESFARAVSIFKEHQSPNHF